MVLASHHVIRDILEAVEGSDLEKLEDECLKFCERYPKDDELHRIICGDDSMLSSYLSSRDDKLLERLKSELQELLNVRKIESSGGEKLWFKDRRP